MPDLSAFDRPWHLSRHIADHRAGATSGLEGRVAPLWQPATQRLHWCESGTLTTPTGAFAATRTTLWAQTPQGIDVHFDDGRPFHRIGPGARPQALHDCPPDTYVLAYDFTAWPDWTLRVRVTGPRKDYTMLSRYAPAS